MAVNTYSHSTCFRGCNLRAPEKTGALENPCGGGMCEESQLHLSAATGRWESFQKAVKQI